MMIDKIIWLVLLSFVPVFELRWSIPIGILGEVKGVPFFGSLNGFAMDPLLVFVVCVLANILAGMIVYFALDRLVGVFCRFNFIKNLYEHFVVRARKQSEGSVKKYGIIGLALFIAVPLPGTGAWTGALIAYILGFGYKRFFIADAIGVTIAGIIVTLVTVFSFSLFGLM